LTLRLFDEAVARSAADFEPSWRAFLQAWNLLQFHPGCRVLTSETLEQAFGQPATPTVSIPLALVAAEGQSTDGDLELILDPEAQNIARRLVERGIVAPIPGFELMQGDAVQGMAEMAWPHLRIAVLVGTQEQDRSAFEAAGWRIAPCTFDALLEALTA
jgi:DEAD/DEAH box helicase domain-containing protein